MEIARRYSDAPKAISESLRGCEFGASSASRSARDRGFGAADRITKNHYTVRHGAGLVRLRILSKILRWVGILIGVLLLIVVGIIMKVDPPPFRLSDPNKAVLSVAPAPKLDGLQHSIENGLACKHKLQSYTSSVYGRPQITFFDWLRHSKGQPAEPDVHLLAGKPDETWAIKVDRSTNMVCYQQPGHVRAGLTDAYCGPKIVHENANQLVAIEDRAFDVVRAIYFDKKKYTMMMTELDESNNTGASIQYFECY